MAASKRNGKDKGVQRAAGASADAGGIAGVGRVETAERPTPVIPSLSRAIGVSKDSPEVRALALERLAQGFSVTAAASAANITRQTLAKWRRNDPAFDAACVAAIEEGTDRLEDAAIVRATEGTPVPVFYKGQIVGHTVQVSDRLMELMLKARRPDKFRERVDHAVAVAVLTPEQLAKAREAGLRPEVEEAARTIASVPVIPASQANNDDPPLVVDS